MENIEELQFRKKKENLTRNKRRKNRNEIEESAYSLRREKLKKKKKRKKLSIKKLEKKEGNSNALDVLGSIDRSGFRFLEKSRRGVSWVEVERLRGKTRTGKSYAL